VAEAKDAELEKVLASNARLRQDLASLQHVRMVLALSISIAELAHNSSHQHSFVHKT